MEITADLMDEELIKRGYEPKRSLKVKQWTKKGFYVDTYITMETGSLMIERRTFGRSRKVLRVMPGMESGRDRHFKLMETCKIIRFYDEYSSYGELLEDL